MRSSWDEAEGWGDLADMPNRSSGHIIAFRGWDITHENHLKGISVSEEWPICMPMRAECLACCEEYIPCRPYELRPNPSPPVVLHNPLGDSDCYRYVIRRRARLGRCRCGRAGLYGRKYVYVEDLGAVSVYGFVALWGRIEEHEMGYRAEFGYPVALIRGNPSPFPKSPCNDTSLIESVARLYEVPTCELADIPTLTKLLLTPPGMRTRFHTGRLIRSLIE